MDRNIILKIFLILMEKRALLFSSGIHFETDTFASNRRITEIHEGDILCFRNAGAYCFSMASNYNSRLKPAEVLWKDGKGHLIRDRETFDDILKNQVMIEI